MQQEASCRVRWSDDERAPRGMGPNIPQKASLGFRFEHLGKQKVDR
jgi:hypothetical protein